MQPLTGYPRDLAGYGERPRSALAERRQIALQFVLNYEKAREQRPARRRGVGDVLSESSARSVRGAHMSMESLYEYGRAQACGALRLFREREVPLTIFGVAMAMLRHPRVSKRSARRPRDREHGWRW